MQIYITILYAFRNRDAQRVQLSLQSLQQQSVQDFEVVFVDYGSETVYTQAVEPVVTAFDFASYHYVGHPGLLWNKSKALNYGVKQAAGEYIFIADVDILFHSETLQLFQQIANPKKAYLFHLSYLSKKVTKSLETTSQFYDLPVKHTGVVNGMVLTSKKSLFDINGVDDFFHFYGSEDVDLFQRLEFSGQQLIQRDENYFLHQWHTIYNSYDDSKLSIIPRLFNIKRINQQHYLSNKEQNVSIAHQQQKWGHCFTPEDKEQLAHPEINLRLPNIEAVVIHFLREELKNYSGKVVSIVFYEDRYYTSLKYKIKTLLGKQSQPYMSMKAVNDEALKTIVFDYRNHNYEYRVAEDLKEIHFILDLKSPLHNG